MEVESDRGLAFVAVPAFGLKLSLLLGKSSMEDGCDMLCKSCIGFDAQPLNQTRLPMVKKQADRAKCCFD